MFRRLGASASGGIWKPKNPHSLEYLKYLHGLLLKNEKITEENRRLLVEALRSLSEILIWGDQNDSSVFDFFLEKQMLSHFLSILKQKCGSFVCVQLLQTLNILFENIRHETSLYFLLSNNHVNSIITHQFDFTNEEIMAYYISFLKTLSFKLNSHTIHFFFNETNEFPLYTEAVKFFKNNESMVRIAVRTLTLNVFKVDDEAMRRFICEKCAHSYFCDLLGIISTQALDMDHFARSAENEASNRDRLNDMIAEHQDHIHYLNDILLLGIQSLNEILCNVVMNRLVSLYLYSILPYRLRPAAVCMTTVSSLFLLAQFLLIISQEFAVGHVLSLLLLGDESDISACWMRVEGAVQLTLIDPPLATGSRVFFTSLVKAMDCSQSDHATFYAMLLVYAIYHNKEVLSSTRGATDFILEAAEISCEKTSRNNDLIEALLAILPASAPIGSSIRPITLELCCIVLRRLILSSDDSSDLHDRVRAITEKTRSELTARLIDPVQEDPVFLDVFEDEYFHFQRSTMRLEAVASESALLLPPGNTAISGLALSRRLASGPEERVRSCVLSLLHVRRLLFDLDGVTDQLNINQSDRVHTNDCINLNNSDLLSCTVIEKDLVRQSRFLVTDQLQLILVEPDTKRLGWGLVCFEGLLQDTQISGDASDSRALHVIVEDAACRARSGVALLSARFLFDDHIRCMAAKQRLTKGRQKAREFRLNQLCQALQLPKRDNLLVVSASENPFRVARGCAPGSVRKQPVNHTPRQSETTSSDVSVPDDPHMPSTSSEKKKVSRIQHL